MLQGLNHAGLQHAGLMGVRHAGMTLLWRLQEATLALTSLPALYRPKLSLMVTSSSQDAVRGEPHNIALSEVRCRKLASKVKFLLNCCTIGHA